MQTQQKAPGKSLTTEISHTADNVCYFRTLTDIPHSKEIFEIVQEITGPFNPEQKEKADSIINLVPLFEVRYTATDWILKNSGIKQVLELASGLSPRGFHWAQDSEIEYVEIDLPGKMHLKRLVVAELARRRDMEPYPNLTLFDGNVCDSGTIIKAQSPFMHEQLSPVATICEGLLRYMSWDDKKKLGNNIHRLLFVHGGGMWITPDIELLSDANATEESRARYEMMARKWKFDVREFLFDDMQHAVHFFEHLGFKVKKYCHADMMSGLISPRALELDEKKVRADLEKRFSFVLTL